MKYYLLIPNLLEILSFVSFLIFFFINTSVGYVISKRTLVGVNFTIGYSICFLSILTGHIFFNNYQKIYFYYIYLFVSLIIIFFSRKILIKYFFVFIEYIKENKSIFFIISSLFIIIFNHKALGWDSFTHWMPMAQNMIDPTIKLTGHALHYPIGSAILPLATSLITGKLIENSYSIFNFFLLFILFNSYFDDFKNFKNFNIRNFLILILIFYVFYNPGILNKFIFSAYSDFFLGVTLLLFLKEINNFDSSKRSLLAIILIAILIINIKNIGIVLLSISFFSFFISRFFLKNLSFYEYKNFLIVIIISLIFYFVWKLTLDFTGNKDSIIRYNNYSQRLDIFILFLKNAATQILERKIFFFSAFLLIIISFVLKKHLSSETRILLIMINLIFIFWNLFLFFMYFVWFSPIEAKGAASYWRYNMILAPTIFYGLLVASIDIGNIIFNEKIIKINKILLTGLGLIIFLLPLFFIDKLRRDINYPNIPSNFFSSTNNFYENAFYYGIDAPYQAERISYYLSKNLKDYKPRTIYHELSNELDENELNIHFLKDLSKKITNNKNKFEIFFINYKDSKNKWIYKKFKIDLK